MLWSIMSDNKKLNGSIFTLNISEPDLTRELKYNK